MTGAILKVSNDFISERSFRLSTKNAWAKLVRSRWRKNTLCEIQREWDLTEGEARGLIYAQASQSTIDKIIDHKRGGFWLALEILCIRLDTSLEQEIRKQAEGIAHERRTFEERERRLAALAAGVSRLRCRAGNDA